MMLFHNVMLFHVMNQRHDQEMQESQVTQTHSRRSEQRIGSSLSNSSSDSRKLDESSCGSAVKPGTKNRESGSAQLRDTSAHLQVHERAEIRDRRWTIALR